MTAWALLVADLLPYLLAGLAVLAVLTIFLRRRRRNTWKLFARKYGFAWRPGPPALVEGQVQGRPFRLYTSESSSDTGLLGVEVVGMSLGLLSTVPEDLEVVNAGAVRAAERPGYSKRENGRRSALTRTRPSSARDARRAISVPESQAQGGPPGARQVPRRPLGRSSRPPADPDRAPGSERPRLSREEVSPSAACDAGDGGIGIADCGFRIAEWANAKDQWRGLRKEVDSSPLFRNPHSAYPQSRYRPSSRLFSSSWRISA